MTPKPRGVAVTAREREVLSLVSRHLTNAEIARQLCLSVRTVEAHVSALIRAAIAVWHAKAHYDAVRPTSAIRWLYGDSEVTAWGGRGQGRVTDLPGRDWCSYLDTADHPEYPSASTALCHAHAESAKRYFGSDELDWAVPVPQGSSHVEPGVTPAADLTLHFET